MSWTAIIQERDRQLKEAMKKSKKQLDISTNQSKIDFIQMRLDDAFVCCNERTDRLTTKVLELQKRIEGLEDGKH